MGEVGGSVETFAFELLPRTFPALITSLRHIKLGLLTPCVQDQKDQQVELFQPTHPSSRAVMGAACFSLQVLALSFAGTLLLPLLSALLARLPASLR